MGTGFDDGEKGARSDVDAGKGAAHHSEDFANEPVVLMIQQELVRGQNGSGIAGGLEDPEAEIQFADAEGENGIIEFASHR